MLMGIREIKDSYPYIENKDIDMVLKVNKLEPQVEYVFANGKPRPYNVRFKKDIEGLFGPIIKDTT